MGQSGNELLAGMDKIKPGEPFPDELFCYIFEIEDLVERTQYLEAARNRARELNGSRSLMQSTRLLWWTTSRK